MTHIHKETPGLRLRKRNRLAIRLGVAIVITCLPLAHHLNSLELISTATALTVLLLGCELWFASCCHDKLFCRSTPCRYVGRCGKKDLDAIVTRGQEVGVETVISSNEKRRNSTVAWVCP